ncbi:MAG: hypothetical protein CL804_01570 [Citromicrobium sp.]|nr:hypothetical protein [Citromicrobium sp.]MAO03212.1 hypothetical protein [Citromicrobium sp.]|tara:strand:- start:635 stop:1141 length:507 start_codon:yes stop_codon:yes gene_type:complete
MIKPIAFAALLLATPGMAQETPTLPSPEQQVLLGVDRFFAALKSSDRTRLAREMIPEGTIFVHNRMNPDNPRTDVVKVSDHLARWAQGTGEVSEHMEVETVLVDGDMAQAWGPYTFFANGKISHCGINSLSMVRTDDGWKVANTSFSMVPPEECESIGAPITLKDIVE